MQLDLWDPRVSSSAVRPMVSTRLDAHSQLQFRLTDLFTNMSSTGRFAMQLRGYLPLPYAHIRCLHASGTSAVHAAHTLIQVGTASGSQSVPAIVRGATALPDGLHQDELYHLHATFTCVPALLVHHACLLLWQHRRIAAACVLTIPVRLRCKCPYDHV
jgi:hypothetical protein